MGASFQMFPPCALVLFQLVLFRLCFSLRKLPLPILADIPGLFPGGRRECQKLTADDCAHAGALRAAGLRILPLRSAVLLADVPGHRSADKYGRRPAVPQIPRRGLSPHVQNTAAAVSGRKQLADGRSPEQTYFPQKP